MTLRFVKNTPGDRARRHHRNPQVLDLLTGCNGQLRPRTEKAALAIDCLRVDLSMRSHQPIAGRRRHICKRESAARVPLYRQTNNAVFDDSRQEQARAHTYERPIRLIWEQA